MASSEDGILSAILMPIPRGIYKSCNTYFSNVYRRIIDKDNKVEENINN